MSRSNKILRRARRGALAATLAGIAPLALAAGTAAADAGHRDDHGRAEYVFTQTNAAGANAVLGFRVDGATIVPVGSFATGGTGTGAGLGDQGAVAVAGRFVVTVDAGSNDVVALRIGRDGTLTPISRVASGGATPTSVTIHGQLVYVLNAGDETVQGFRLDGGRLRPIPGSHQQLTGAGAAEIAFDAEGRRLVVTQKASSTIEVLPVRAGVAGAPVSSPSAGATPFGFAVDARDHVIVSNANGGAANASSLSSYRLDGTSAQVVSGEVATTQTAACWVALSEDGQFAYTTNAGSGTTSSYRIDRDGSLTLLQAVAEQPGAGPIDLAVEGRDLLTLAGRDHVLTLDRIQPDGSLVRIAQAPVPAGVTGLAAIG